MVATAGARALCENNQDRGAYEFARGKLQAAHPALEKLDRMSHVHFINPEVLASLRLEIDPDNAATAFEEKAIGAETWLSIRKRFCS
ncbi:MAG: hypothetical protein R6W88_11410 [Desulfobacterales bacterium]